MAKQGRPKEYNLTAADFQARYEKLQDLVEVAAEAREDLLTAIELEMDRLVGIRNMVDLVTVDTPGAISIG